MIPNIHANDTVQYADGENLIGRRIHLLEAVTPIEKPLVDIVAYFTGAAPVRTWVRSMAPQAARYGQIKGPTDA
jgi:hypothetical protein